MSRIAVLGARHRVEGFALAGALVLVAEGEAEVREALDAVPDDVGVLVVTPEAIRALGGPRPPMPLVVELPG